MNNIKIFGVSFVLTAMLFSPFLASAQQTVSTADLQAQIAALLAQVQQLQAQLAALNGGSGTATSAWCHTFTANLQIGNTGSEVAALQTALGKESGVSAVPASEINAQSFGEGTAAAVVAFQEKYASDILVPADLTHGTGYVGSLTRAKLNHLYGCGTNANSTTTTSGTGTPAVVSFSSSAGNTAVASGANVTYTFSVSGAAVDHYTFSVSCPSGIVSSICTTQTISGTASAVSAYFTNLTNTTEQVQAVLHAYNSAGALLGENSVTVAVNPALTQQTSSLVISNLHLTTTATSATFDWITNSPASSVVNYGISSYQDFFVSNPTLVTTHHVVLPTLTPGQHYLFQVFSMDANLSTAVSNGDFSTPIINASTTTNLSVTPTSLSFSVQSTAINNPSPANSQLTLAVSPVDATVSVTKTYTSSPAGADWLAVGPVTGSGSTRTVTVTPQPWNAPAGLGVGTYAASIVFSANGQTLVTVPVALTVSGNTAQQPTLTISLDPSSPAAQQLVMGSTGNTLAAFRFTASNTEAIKVGSFGIAQVTGDKPGEAASFSNFALYLGSTIVGTAATPTYDSALNVYTWSFNFGIPVTVPAGGSITLTLRGDVPVYSSGAATDGASFAFYIGEAKIGAVGATSNISPTITGAGVGTISSYATIVRTKISVTASGLGVTTNRIRSSADDFGTLNFCADPAGGFQLSSVRVTFAMTTTPLTDFVNAVRLVDQNGISISPSSVSSACTGSQACSANFAIVGGQVIPAGTCYAYKVRINSALLSSSVTQLNASIYAGTDVSYFDALTGGALLTLPQNSFPIQIQSANYPMAGNSNPLTITSPVNTSWSAVTNQFPVGIGLTATGGNGGYSWTITNGMLPPGLSLTTSGGTVSISGKPTTGGTYVFTLNVQSGTEIVSRQITYTIITNPLSLTAPVGGEQWQTGTQQTIWWQDSQFQTGQQYTSYLVNAQGGAYGTIGSGIYSYPSNLNTGWLVGYLTGQGTTPVPPGTYYIQIAKQGNSAYIMSNPFTITAPSAASMSVSPASLAFTATAGTNPSQQNLTLTNNSSQTIYWSRSSSASWLSTYGSAGVMPAAPYNTGSLPVTIDTTGLAAGTYTGTLTFSPQNPNYGPNFPAQVVNVTLIVTASHPTATFTISNYGPSGSAILQSGANITASVGDRVQYDWSSSNGTAWGGYYSVNTPDTCLNGQSDPVAPATTTLSYLMNSSGGSVPYTQQGSTISECFAGHTYYVTYWVKNSAGEVTTANATIVVNSSAFNAGATINNYLPNSGYRQVVLTYSGLSGVDHYNVTFACPSGVSSYVYDNSACTASGWTVSGNAQASNTGLRNTGTVAQTVPITVKAYNAANVIVGQKILSVVVNPTPWANFTIDRYNSNNQLLNSGVTNVTANIGDKITYNWSSTNGAVYNATVYADAPGASCGLSTNSASPSVFGGIMSPTSPNTMAQGTILYTAYGETLSPCFASSTGQSFYHLSYEVTDNAGEKMATPITITVNPYVAAATDQSAQLASLLQSLQALVDQLVQKAQ